MPGASDAPARRRSYSLVTAGEVRIFGFEILVVILMVAINAIFASYEIALASVSITRLKSLEQAQRWGAKAASAMKTDLEGSLAVVQLGITLVGVIAAATSGAGAEERVAPLFENLGLSHGLADALALACVAVPLTAFTIVVGELVPKLFAIRNKELVCLTLSPVMQGFARLIWPAVWLLETSAGLVMKLAERLQRAQGYDMRSEATELQELRAVASLARTARLIGPREERIILGAVRLSSRPVREIMLPAEHISMLNVSDSMADCLIKAHLDMHTRFPVTERPGDPQAIMGYATFKDIVALVRLSPQTSSLRGIIRKLVRLPEDLAISTVLERLMHEYSHIALLENAHGKIVGLITLEDILEELIGDIQDEWDLLPAYAVQSGDGWVMGGGVSLLRVQELTETELAPADAKPTPRNLSSWIIEQLGHPPSGGEILTTGSLRILVRKVRRQRVLEASLLPLTAPESEEP
ncbi:hemolysin family protein [Planctomicrobium sp. SH664]|uniref:hemolysin family protein n=1 Tax=Planctomicrobium sp. SH664 TaxID=3448125 RepID=UPI003F5B1F8C